jgi:HAD superfamily hydrolase (TIGR01509 family)
MIKLVIFDIGGVLVDYQEERYYRYLSEKLGLKYMDVKKPMEKVLSQIELGRIKLWEAEALFADEFGVEESKLDWISAFKKLAKPRPQMITLLNKISKRYRVVLLSDVSESRYVELEKMLICKLHIEKAFISCKMGLRKREKDPELWPYRHVLKETGMKPEDVLFIDDWRHNIIGARSAGINCIQFKSYEQLVKDLKRKGIKYG